MDGCPQHMQKHAEGICPEIPQRAQSRGTYTKKQNRPTQRAQQHIAPQKTLRAVQREEKQRAAGAQTVNAVQQGGAAGQPQPQCPQKIIEQRRADAQQNGLGEQLQLL